MSLFHFIIEALYQTASKLVSNPGWALLLLSAGITLLLLPLYGLIHLIEQRLAPRKAKFQHLEDELRCVYQGQTLQMYLRTLYRQQNYPRWVPLLPILIPLLQLPFFFAAYQVLSLEPTLKGMGFWGITDLSRPDGLIHLGSMTLNLLPLVMTALNLSAVEQTGKATSTQRFMALGFFVLLYSMPAGLLVYWSSNNFWQWLMALIKNPSIGWLKDRVRELGGLARDAVRLNQQKLNRYQLTGLIFTALLPVMHYTYSNIAFLDNYYLLEIFLKLFVPSIIAIYFSTRVSQHFITSPLLGILASAAILSFFLTPLWLHLHQARIEDAQWHLILLYTLTTIIFVWASLRARVFFVVGLVLFVVTFGRFTARYVKRQMSFLETTQKIELPNELKRAAVKKPNIYFLIYDAYVPKAMTDYFGIDNAEQFEFLKQNGFKIYEDKFSFYGSSLKSDSLVLNLGLKVKKERRVLAGHGVFDAWLKENGYRRIYYANDYFFQEEKEVAPSEIIFPNTRHNVLLAGILEGEFKFDLIAKSYDDETWREKKTLVLKEQSPTPRFVFSHSKYPGHTQNSGQCLPNERELFEERLKKANTEMMTDVEIIKQQDPGAIIITAGDHGIHLTGDCTGMKKYSSSEIGAEHLLDRYLVHVGIRWPSDADTKQLNFVHLHGALRSVASYMIGNQEIILSEPTRPICLRDVCLSPDGTITGGRNNAKNAFEILPSARK